MALDKLDVNLLKLLKKDGRAPLRKLAKNLGISTVTVMKRMKKLKRDGILQGFTVKVNPNAIGYGLTAVISLKAKGKKLIEVQEKIAKNPKVCGVYDITGEFDSVIIARFKSVPDLNNFVKNVLSMAEIERTYTQVALNVIKEDFGPNL